MSGLKLTIEAVFLLFANFAAAFRISFLPTLIIWGSGIVGMYLLTGKLSLNPIFEITDPYSGNGTPPAGIWLFLVVFGVVTMLCIAWAAVAWHRFILLSEGSKSLVPRFQVKRILGYIWRSVILVLILLLIGLVVGFVMGIAIRIFMSADAGMGMMLALNIFAFLIGVLILYLLTRMSLILPGIAIGKPLTVGDSFSETGDFRLEILVAAIALSAAQWAAASLVEMSFALPMLAVLLSFVTDWFFTIFGLAFLSVLYRHAITLRFSAPGTDPYGKDAKPS